MLRALVDHRAPGADRAVKDFVWHPEDDRIFFVDGYAFGTVSVGGVIRSVDMEGKVTTVLEPDGKRSELAGPMSIQDGYLRYRIVRFDEQFIAKTIEDARLPVADP
jgi:hypothetical protein